MLRSGCLVLCIFAILVAMSSAAPIATMTLKRFTEEEANTSGARCLDGSPGGYYFSPAGSPANSTKWVILLESGGYCFDRPSCRTRTSLPVGSSKSWPETLPAAFGLISNTASMNPDFWDWNFIRVPYCSGDFHSGTRREAIKETWGLYFSGHLQIKAILRDVTNIHGFSKATEVVLTGTSAGGYGVFLNADFVAQAAPPTARVVAVPQAGLFLWPLTFDQWTSARKSNTLLVGGAEGKAPEINCEGNTVDAVEEVLLSELHFLWKSYVNEDCAKAQQLNHVTRCLNPAVSYPFIKTQLFISNNFYDSDQIFKDLGAPGFTIPMTKDLQDYVDYFGVCMKRVVDQVANSTKGDGVFMPKCLAHLLPIFGPNAPFVHNRTMLESLSGWYTGSSSTSDIDQCEGVLCNPSCGPPDHTVSWKQEHPEQWKAQQERERKHRQELNAREAAHRARVAAQAHRRAEVEARKAQHTALVAAREQAQREREADHAARVVAHEQAAKERETAHEQRVKAKEEAAQKRQAEHLTRVAQKEEAAKQRLAAHEARLLAKQQASAKRDTSQQTELPDGSEQDQEELQMALNIRAATQPLIGQGQGPPPPLTRRARHSSKAH